MHSVLCWLFGICYAVEQYEEEKWQIRGSEHLLLLMLINTEIWGLSTEHATAASEIIKCAAQTNISQFTLMTSPHSVSCICDCYWGEHLLLFV